MFTDVKQKKPSKSAVITAILAVPANHNRLNNNSSIISYKFCEIIQKTLDYSTYIVISSWAKVQMSNMHKLRCSRKKSNIEKIHDRSRSKPSA